MSSDTDLSPDEPTMPDVAWDIRRAGRAWGAGEAMARFALTPEKVEMCDGKLFWSEAERLTLLGLLLENVGVDAACAWAIRRCGDRRSVGCPRPRLLP